MQKVSPTDASVQKVLTFAVNTPKVSDRQVYFLFSIKQMEDILMEAAVTPVPFSQPYLKGIAQWHDTVVPVISLEECLGLEHSNSREDTRLIVTQVPTKDADRLSFYRIMLQVIPPMQMLTLPIDCDPVSGIWIPEGHLVRGVYEWENKFLVVAHMEKILDGVISNRKNKHV
ncbi:MAG: chemotaxis protein CheW [Desulfobacterales bacterium]|jgi:chemotaxis signal transduction protein